MLRKILYPHIESLLNQTAGVLHKQGITPNQLTLGGLALNFLAGWIYASGSFFFGAVMMLIAALGDMLDGPLARSTGQVSKFGAFLDSTIDRYSDFFIFGGVALYFAKEGQNGWFLITMGILAGAFVTSYAKARAENLIEKCDAGIFERPERIVILAIGSVFPFLRSLALLVLLIGTNATAVQRILYVRKNLPPPQKVS